MSTFHDLVDTEPGDDQPETGRVVKTSPKGAFVVPLGADNRNPIGPCRGLAASKGDVVLLVWTDDGPWIAAIDTTGGS